MSSSFNGPPPSGSHVVSPHTLLFIPVPSGCHSDPSNRAILFTVFPLPIVKSPPATSCAVAGPGPSGSQVVSPITWVPPLKPLPRCRHSLPCQIATLLTVRIPLL